MDDVIVCPTHPILALLQDFGREAGQVLYSAVKEDPSGREGRVGVLEFASQADMDNALARLNGKTMRGAVVQLEEESASNSFNSNFRGAPAERRVQGRPRSRSRSRGRGGYDGAASALEPEPVPDVAESADSEAHDGGGYGREEA